MGVLSGSSLISDNQEWLAAGRLNETRLSYVTDHFGIHGIAMDGVSCCYPGLVLRKDPEMAANQLLTPVEEFLRSHPDNVMVIVFDNFRKWEKKLATALRVQNKKKLSNDEIKKCFQERERGREGGRGHEAHIGDPDRC